MLREQQTVIVGSIPAVVTNWKRIVIVWMRKHLWMVGGARQRSRFYSFDGIDR